MLFISHRGNLYGSYPHLENHPDYILNALNNGFDCECDVRYKDGEWWLGHDYPQYIINSDFLKQKGLWIHAKNIEALQQLSKIENINYFWHENDKYTLTSKGYIWAYPGSELNKDTVCVMPENNIENNDKFMAFAICSDFIMREKSDEIFRNS